MTKKQLFGIPFDDVTTAEAAEIALSLLKRDRSAYIVTPNPEIVLSARKNADFMAALTSADLIIPDGVGLVLASKIIGCPLANRIPGIDLASLLMEKLARMRGSVYLYGGKPGVALRAADAIVRNYPNLRVAGCRHGYLSPEEESVMLDEIRSARPDLLLICTGFPRQELWMQRHAHQMPHGLMIGLGGAMDVYAGDIRRAPSWMRKAGLEWLYRLIRQPKRLNRMFRLPAVFWAALKERNR